MRRSSNVRTTITRPANVTAYSAGDVVGGAFEIQSIGDAGTDILINFAALMPYLTAIPAGMTSFRLALYDANPASGIADNLAWTLAAGDRANFLGFIDLGSPALLGATTFAQVPQTGFQCRLADGKSSLWAYLVTNGAFTPAANSETYDLFLRSSAF